MSSRSLRLHAKLYRARAIDQAMALIAQDNDQVALEKRRVGDHYEITREGPDAETDEILAELADLALVLTVEQDRR